jgi:hypothetical protein
MPDWELALVQFLVGLGYAVIQGALTGKLSAPTVIHVAVPTPTADSVVGDAIVTDVMGAK